jgi:putative membrane protein
MPHGLRPILLVVLLGTVLVFAVQNVADVEVQFLLWSLAMPRAILIMVAFALGVLLGWILHSLHRRRHYDAASPDRRPED